MHATVTKTGIIKSNMQWLRYISDVRMTKVFALEGMQWLCDRVLDSRLRVAGWSLTGFTPFRLGLQDHPGGRADVNA